MLVVAGTAVYGGGLHGRKSEREYRVAEEALVECLDAICIGLWQDQPPSTLVYKSYDAGL
jgi:hypothetical protein